MVFVIVFMAVNHSQMANLGLRTYSNTFGNMFGTSRMSTKSGSFHPFVLPKRFNKHKKNPIHLKHILFSYLNIMDLQSVDNVGKDGHRKMMKIHLKNHENLGYGTNIYQKT